MYMNGTECIKFWRRGAVATNEKKKEVALAEQAWAKGHSTRTCPGEARRGFLRSFLFY